MPIYEYRCENGHDFEVMQRMSDDPLTTCEVCGATVQKVLSPVAVHFKGSGFYTTDYGKKKGAGAGGDSKGAESGGGSDSGGGGSESGGGSGSESGSGSSGSDSGSSSGSKDAKSSGSKDAKSSAAAAKAG